MARFIIQHCSLASLRATWCIHQCCTSRLPLGNALVLSRLKMVALVCLEVLRRAAPWINVTFLDITCGPYFGRVLCPRVFVAPRHCWSPSATGVYSDSRTWCITTYADCFSSRPHCFWHEFFDMYMGNARVSAQLHLCLTPVPGCPA